VASAEVGVGIGVTYEMHPNARLFLTWGNIDVRLIIDAALNKLC
jgi:hypothetical protein